MRSTLFLATTILCTSVAYAQFQLQDSHTSASLRGIHSLGDGVAWASGTEGTILHTTDNGANWQRCTTPPKAEKLDFRGIQAFDQNTAIIMSSGKGDLSRLYKTTDACKTWKLVFANPDQEGFWDAIQFSPKDHNFGVLLGDPVRNIFVVMRTLNGGDTWERETLNATIDIDGESIFAASNSSLLISHPGFRKFCTGGSGGPRVIRLGAGPSHRRSQWNAGIVSERLRSLKQRPSSGCFSMAEDNGDVTVAVGGDYLNPDDRSYTAWTNSKRAGMQDDEGLEFHLASSFPHGYRSAVAYDERSKTWIAIGPNGTDISRDDGRNWTALKPGSQDQPDADKNWNALSLPFVVGPKGRIGKLRPDRTPNEFLH